MSIGKRQARHEILAASVPEGRADPKEWWFFTAGQRVLTIEGIPGEVVEIEDGPTEGNETYIVELDDGLGGGQYSASELKSLDDVPLTSTASITTQAYDDCEDEGQEQTDEDSTHHVASEDYPELSNILVERPPLGDMKIAASLIKQAQLEDDDDTPLTAVEAGVFNRILDGPAGSFNEHLDPSVKPDGFGKMWSNDWCRFRKSRQCFYPKELDTAASNVAGYRVWIPEFRGVCPRDKWDDQKTCPISQPGPNSGEPNALTDATTSWNDGGQRGGTPEVTASSHFTVEAIRAEAEFHFHFTSSWKDVRAKAKKIRSEGGVRIIRAPGGLGGTDNLYIQAEVKGDHGVYQTTLLRSVNAKTVASWECGCAWSSYSWGRSGRWKKYEGRMCSHALATQYEAQAQEIFGGHLVEQPTTPPWRVKNAPSQYVKPDQRTSSLEDDEAPIVSIARGMLEDGELATTVLAYLVESGMDEPILAMGEAMSGPDMFKVKDPDTGFTTDVTIQDGEAVDVDSGKTIDNPLHPSYDPTLGLDINDGAPEYKGPTIEAETDIAGANQSIYLTGHPPEGSDLTREFAVTPASTDFFADEADDISRAYRDMPLIDPSVVPLWEELGELVTAQANALRAQYNIIVYDDLDPYNEAGPMHADIDNGVYKVTTMHSHHPVWDVPTNVNFRIVHDILGHGVAASDFSLRGEVLAYQAECMVTPEKLWPALFTEIIAQSAYVNVHHLFGEQKVGLLPLSQAQIDAHVGKIMDGPDPEYDALHQSASLNVTADGADSSEGVMIAFRPPDDVLEAIVLDGDDAEPLNNLHITLLYLGKMKDVDPFALHNAVQGWAVGTTEKIGTISGYGTFVNGDEEVLYAGWDVPGLHEDRVRLEHALADFGIVSPSEHGFTPHTTLRYGDLPESLPTLPDAAKREVVFTEVAVVVGPVWTYYNLGAGGPSEVKNIEVNADLHDADESALPFTTSDDDMDDTDIGDDGLSGADQHGNTIPLDDDSEMTTASKTASVDVLDPSSRSWLMDTPKSAQSDTHDIAEAARAVLSKMAGKEFTLAERESIIGEGAEEGVTASNLKDLNLKGTHYEELEAAISKLEEEDENGGPWW